jgi:hypothetical protein
MSYCKGLPLLLAGGVLLLFSCVSTAQREEEQESALKVSAQNTSSVSLVEAPDTIDFLTYEDGILWNTLPDGNPIFFAAAPRMADRKAEEEECLSRAAVQASKFIAVQAKARYISQKTNTGVGYTSEIEINYDRELAEQLKGELTVEKTYQDNEGTYMVTRLQSRRMEAIPFKPYLKKGKPTWIENTPEISGYYTAVGVAQRSRFIADSIAAADDMALEDLIKQISINIKSSRSDISVDRVGTATDQINYEEASATVAGFYVIARWRTEDGSHYYSLAVCPKK